MKNRKTESNKNFKQENSLNDFMFYCNYNKNVSKNKFKNSLSTSEISYFDSLLETSIPKKSQIAQKMYSRKSDIFNDSYRLSKKKFKNNLRILGLSTNEVKNHRNNLKKSEITLNEEIIVYRGFKVFYIDPKKLKETQGYISTSVDKAVACGYTRGIGKVIEIKVPKGTKIMYLRKYSVYPKHMEVLIPPKYYTHEYKIENQIKYEIRKRI